MIEKNGKPLPAGWVYVPLGELGAWSGGGTPSKSKPEFWDRGTVPWVSPKDMKCFEMYDSEDHITESAISRSSATIVPPGTVLMVTRSGILRHTFPVAVSRAPVTMNQDLKSVTPFPGIRAPFVARALQAFGQRIIHTCVKDGTTVQSIEVPALKSFQLPLAPEKEQQRISDAIDELLSDLDAGVGALERARTKLKQYRSAVLKAAVEGSLTAEWRARNPGPEPASKLLDRILAERRRRWEAAQLQKFQAAGKSPTRNWKAKYKEPKAPKSTSLPPLPSKWCWATWDQVGVSQNGRPFPSSKYQDTGVKLLRPGNLYSTGLVGWNSRNTRCLPTKFAEESPDLIIAAGELVMNLTAQSLKDDFLGRVCITSNDEYCLLNQRLARLTPVIAEPRYMLWLFKSPQFRAYVADLNTGSLIQHMFTSQLCEYTFPLPPLDEQAAIADAVEDQLSVIEHLEAVLDTRLRGATALRQSILRHAFTGHLVAQDPADEPASELLKRIAAEREERARQAQSAKRVKAKPKKSKPPRPNATTEKAAKARK